MRAPDLLSLALFAFVASLAASVACSNQGEGAFCDTNNGNNDCQDGLTCGPAPGLSSSLTNRDRCCPVLPAQPTTAACALNTATVIDASTEVPDAQLGSGPDGEAGGPSEASAADAVADGVSADSPGDVVVARVPEGGHEGGADASPE